MLACVAVAVFCIRNRAGSERNSKEGLMRGNTVKLLVQGNTMRNLAARGAPKAKSSSKLPPSLMKVFSRGPPSKHAAPTWEPREGRDSVSDPTIEPLAAGADAPYPLVPSPRKSLSIPEIFPEGSQPKTTTFV